MSGGALKQTTDEKHGSQAHGAELAQAKVKKQPPTHHGFVKPASAQTLGSFLANAYYRAMNSLEGQFLVAMPDMQDENFARSVILIVGHGTEGAMGLMVNQELDNLRFADILDELDLGDPDAVIRLPDTIRDRAVMRGGPVEKGRGFVLHSGDYHSGNTYKVSDDLGLTATLDVLKAMAFGPAPRRALFALGCCGWSPGQLEDEISANGWLTVPFSRELLFEVPVDQRYERALESLHITPATLSPDAGHA